MTTVRWLNRNKVDHSSTTSILGRVGNMTLGETAVESHGPCMQEAQIKTATRRESPGPGPRIALLTPYSGGNLGDASIQDAVIANLRQRMPSAQFCGITLDCRNFLEQHGVRAFPLLADSFKSRKGSAKRASAAETSDAGPDSDWKDKTSGVKRALWKVPGFVPFLKGLGARLSAVLREVRHSAEGYRVLRNQDLLIVSGGGQLDERWGGPWRFPFAVCKWVLLARIARVPSVMVSVGACQITSRAARTLFWIALHMCSYRSYREANTRAMVASFLPRAMNDSVVPDLAFSLPDSELPLPTGRIRALARGRPIVALSPIAYAKPKNWPIPDRAVYNRHVREMGRVLSSLCRRGYFVIVACSSLGDDESVIPDLLAGLDDEVKRNLDNQVYFPPIKSWRDFVATLYEADYLVASRLHGTILSFVAKTPVIAISFDPKVDWVMEDLRLTDYLLHIRDFTAGDVLDALDRMRPERDSVVERIGSYRQSTLSALDRQYDSVAGIVAKHHRSTN